MLSRTAAVLCAVSMLATACTGAADSIVGNPLPTGMPQDFPIPEGAVISEPVRLQNPAATQIAVALPLRRIEAVRFFNVELVNAGYVVDRSRETETGWEVLFSKDDLSGSIVIAGSGPESEATIEVRG